MGYLVPGHALFYLVEEDLDLTQTRLGLVPDDLEGRGVCVAAKLELGGEGGAHFQRHLCGAEIEDPVASRDVPQEHVGVDDDAAAVAADEDRGRRVLRVCYLLELYGSVARVQVCAGEMGGVLGWRDSGRPSLGV